MAYKFALKTSRCQKCHKDHTLAVRAHHCGRIDYGYSPNTLLCYACQMKQTAPATWAILVERYRLLWAVATAGNTPLPPELAP